MTLMVTPVRTDLKGEERVLLRKVATDYQDGSARV
jgi:hypothetical protein